MMMYFGDMVVRKNGIGMVLSSFQIFVLLLPSSNPCFS